MEKKEACHILVPNELRNAELITVQLGLQWTCSRSFIMLNIWTYVAWYYCCVPLGSWTCVHHIHKYNKMPCYRREYRAMPLQISVHIKVFSGIGRFSLR